MNETDRTSEESTAAEPRRLQKCLDWFYRFRGGAVDRLAYYSMRVYGIEDVSLADIKRGAYDHQEHKNRELEKAHETNLLLSSAKECYTTAEERRSAITDKCKTLLTMSSILLGLVGLLLPKSLAFEVLWMRTVCFVAILGLLNVIVLLLTFFAVGTESRMTLDQSEVDLEPKDFEKNRINLYLQCQVAADNRTDYLVDLYKVARFFFLSSFTLVVILFSISFLSSSPKTASEDVIRKLRSDPELIKLLRGPKGGKGDQGDQGGRGLPGQKGDKGDRGQDAVLDNAKLIEEILNDPRLKQQIERVIQSARDKNQTNGQNDGGQGQ